MLWGLGAQSAVPKKMPGQKIGTTSERGMTRDGMCPSNSNRNQGGSLVLDHLKENQFLGLSPTNDAMHHRLHKKLLLTNDKMVGFEGSYTVQRLSS